MKRVHAAWRWLCVVSPPAWVVGLALLFYAAFAGLQLFMHVANARKEYEEFGQVCAVLVIVMTAGYALFRGVMFHPARQYDYLAWLVLTPWRHPKPLPVGPVHVVAQDFVWLAMFELLLLLDGTLGWRLMIPVVFVFVLAASWAVWMWILDSRAAAYEIGYLLGAVVWCASWSYWAATMVLTATTLWALYRYRQSLGAFPWDAYHARQQQRRQAKALMHRSPDNTGRAANWGWTFDLLSPQRTEQLPLQDRLLLSLLLGWVCNAVVSFSQIDDLVPGVFMLTVFAAGFYAAWTVFRYIKGHAPPISLLGRLATGRWVIPSYDVALLPVVYFLLCLAVGVYWTSPLIACPVRFVLPAMLTGYLLLVNLACPDLNKWRLTCPSRLSAWTYAAEKREYEQL